MDADTLIRAVQTELQKHSFDTFPDELPLMSRGGRGVVVSGCPACKKRFQSLNQFVTHLSEDVLPTAIRGAVSQQGVGPDAPNRVRQS
jgi:hypothetical protein